MILRFLPLFEESLFLSQSLRIRKLTVTWHNDDYIGRKAFRAPPGIIDINTDLVERRREGGRWVGAGIERRVLTPSYVLARVTRVYSLKSLC